MKAQVQMRHDKKVSYVLYHVLCKSVKKYEKVCKCKKVCMQKTLWAWGSALAPRASTTTNAQLQRRSTTTSYPTKKIIECLPWSSDQAHIPAWPPLTPVLQKTKIVTGILQTVYCVYHLKKPLPKTDLIVGNVFLKFCIFKFELWYFTVRLLGVGRLQQMSQRGLARLLNHPSPCLTITARKWIEVGYSKKVNLYQ